MIRDHIFFGDGPLKIHRLICYAQVADYRMRGSLYIPLGLVSKSCFEPIPRYHVIENFVDQGF